VKPEDVKPLPHATPQRRNVATESKTWLNGSSVKRVAGLAKAAKQ
jgi:hypothetical protein